MTLWVQCSNSVLFKANDSMSWTWLLCFVFAKFHTSLHFWHPTNCLPWFDLHHHLHSAEDIHVHRCHRFINIHAPCNHPLPVWRMNPLEHQGPVGHRPLSWPRCPSREMSALSARGAEGHLQSWDVPLDPFARGTWWDTWPWSRCCLEGWSDPAGFWQTDLCALVHGRDTWNKK